MNKEQWGRTRSEKRRGIAPKKTELHLEVTVAAHEQHLQLGRKRRFSQKKNLAGPEKTQDFKERRFRYPPSVGEKKKSGAIRPEKEEMGLRRRREKNTNASGEAESKVVQGKSTSSGKGGKENLVPCQDRAVCSKKRSVFPQIKEKGPKEVLRPSKKVD